MLPLQCRRSLESTISSAVLDGQIAFLNVTGISQTLPEGGHIRSVSRGAIDKSDQGQRRHCARAAIGHAIAAPPTSVMNSRRWIWIAKRTSLRVVRAQWIDNSTS